MKELEKIIYFSGIFDGEGCVYAYRRKNTFSLEIEISMTHLPTLKHLQSTFDLGTINPIKKREGCKQAFRYRLRGNQASSVLKQIQPYLITKKEEVDTALILHEYNQETKYIRSEEVIEKKEELLQKLKELKTYEFKSSESV